MSMERATGLIIRTTDFSETSRIVTMWTRELGKVRALAKGGRRLKSNFEVALDLLTLCDIVLIRKSSGSLDLLTEARVRERFPHLRDDLAALYAGYYVAELLGDLTSDHDAHPPAFDAAIDALRELGRPLPVGQAFQSDCQAGKLDLRGEARTLTGVCLAHFELVLLRELGYGPALDFCADCGESLTRSGLAFSAAGGGVLCALCQPKHREKRPLAQATWLALQALQSAGDRWRAVEEPGVRSEIRNLLNHYVTYQLGRRPRLLPYLGS